MKRSGLHTTHEALGAVFQAEGEWEMPAHYGDPAAENLAVRKNVGMADLSHRGKFFVTGDDRLTWLQSIVSNDLLSLQTGHGLYSSMMNHKGKILSYFRVFRLEDRLFVEDVGEIEHTTSHVFRKFLLYGTKAKMIDCQEQWGQVLVSGPRACDLVQEALGIDTSGFAPLQCMWQDFGQGEGLMARTEETGEWDLSLFLLRPGLVSVWERLWKAGTRMGLRAFGTLARQSLRIEAGIPYIGPDLNESIVPPEANLEGKAFSLSKGCYPGQEVVARMDTYGTVKRRMVGLVIDVSHDKVPPHGAKLFSGKREVGWISSAAYSPSLQKVIALGFPLRDFTTPGTALEVEVHGATYPATVQALPFYVGQ